jgi:hypothetical protein
LPRNEAVEQELCRLTEEGGGTLSPWRVVEVARNKSNPLHECFEWSDAVAASKYRLTQARELIRSFQVCVTVESMELRIPKYVRNSTLEGSEAGYCLLLSIKDDTEKQAVIKDEMRTAMAHLRRACDIALAIANPRLHGVLVQEVLRIEKYLETLG